MGSMRSLGTLKDHVTCCDTGSDLYVTSKLVTAVQVPFAVNLV